LYTKKRREEKKKKQSLWGNNGKDPGPKVRDPKITGNERERRRWQIVEAINMSKGGSGDTGIFQRFSKTEISKGLTGEKGGRNLMIWGKMKNHFPGEIRRTYRETGELRRTRRKPVKKDGGERKTSNQGLTD